MTGRGAPRGCRPYGAGPWLVVHGNGVESENIATSVESQCLAREVEVVGAPVDDLTGHDFGVFTSLIVSLPSELGRSNVRDALQPFQDTVDSYRARRRGGLQDVVDGSRRWFEVGVVQLAGPTALINHPALRATRELACVIHRLDGSAAIDVFAPYSNPLRTGASLAPAGDGSDHEDVSAAEVASAWRRVAGWGVSDSNDVPKMLDCIHRCRQHYERPSFSQLYRPIAGVARNRLDIILDGPVETVVGDPRTWAENGARVWRHVEGQLREVVSTFRRPRAGKGAVKDLHVLYRDLRIVDLYQSAAQSDPSTTDS